MSDPDVEREEAIARDYIATTIARYLVSPGDAGPLAEHIVGYLRTKRRWKPDLRPPAARPRPTTQQAAQRAKRGADAARRALANPQTVIGEDHPHA